MTMLNPGFPSTNHAAVRHNQHRTIRNYYRSPLYPTVQHFDASGIRLPNAPRWSLNITPEYRRKMGSRLQTSVAFDAVYRAAPTGGERLSNATESYWVFNGRIGIAKQNGRWSVTLWGRNIFDRAYFLSAYLGNGTYVRVNAPPGHMELV